MSHGPSLQLPLQPPLTEISVLSSAVSVQTNTADLLHVTQDIVFPAGLACWSLKGQRGGSIAEAPRCPA